MKHLLLVRHAKSSWESGAATDFERPLNKRGHHDLPNIAARIRCGLEPLLKDERQLWFSPAERTCVTAQAIALRLDLTGEQLQAHAELYESTSDALREAIQQCDNRYQTLIVVAHNPGLQTLITDLCAHELDTFPTGAAALLSLPINHWKKLRNSVATLKWLDTPKQPFFTPKIG